MHIQKLKYKDGMAALSIADWHIEAGQHWGIFSSQSQCSALIVQLLSGELSANSGEISDSPQRIACVSLLHQQRLLEEEIAKDETDFQDSIDYGSTVEQLISNMGCSQSELDDVIDKTDLQALRQRPFRQLSTGETRRAMLARALVTKPELLILDEPYTGLDKDHRLALSQLLNRCAQQMQLIVITSREDELPACISHVALFDHHSLTQTMTLDEWHNHPIKQHIKKLSQQKGGGVFELIESYHEQKTLHDPLIDMNNVKVEYLDGVIFKDFNWQAKIGQHWQIRGPNGCGKSTLLGLIMGDHPQCYSNDITVLGMKRGSGESIWDIKKQIGIVSSALHLQYRVNCSSLDVLLSGFFDSIGLYEQPSKKQIQIAQQWLNVLEMSEFEKVGFKTLDYGQQRLLLIGRALIKQPALLVLDEPYQGLDYINRKLVFFVLNRIAKTNMSQLLYVTHYAEDSLEAIEHFIDFEPVNEGHRLVVS
ncbi:ABC transporter [Vibrio sp. UCD-FRSSP16_10]|uniref:ATP-binding cassette domain-containing protein n=1 Tax=unclassified Vibrio TaxID=2614977 RepID=UPI0007FCBBC7|nr:MULTISPECIES: ATP-binding cassette domain-containing protein [unclassified Vibrio]OBT16460.1 ABC transporter [Vibrio sp. UCD-FRSSP16_30]OBT21276.1 ABC transporter [Vibrio sp. UCD-FRSSP16_10]